jgi:ferredoxin
MGTGPGAEDGFDLGLTELEDSFLVKVGSEAGRLALSGLKVKPASAFLLQTAQRGLQEARQNMGRELSEIEKLPDQLLDALEHPHWEHVAARCMSCASCTQVCPTCFCWAPLDHLDITGGASSRIRVWDSCFNPNYSYISGGNTRPNTHARYRQWLTHKFASWQHQYDTPGCVGCGRCITWCPVGIDVTEEIAAVRKDASA